MKSVKAILFLLLLGSCTSPHQGLTPIDLVPMYGGVDRYSIPEQKAADLELIENTSKEFGTREKASIAFVNRGFQLYEQGNLDMAMKRFNQAWLLNPDNPEVFWGFGTVLHDQGKNCEARKMMEKALEYDVYYTGLYPDAARIYTLCAVGNDALTEETKNNYFLKAQELYEKASASDSNKAYVYGSWATALYWQGKYSQAWEKVDRQREFGGEPGSQFLSLLQEKMPKP